MSNTGTQAAKRPRRNTTRADAKTSARATARSTRSLLVDVLVLLADADHAHFRGVLPRLVALGCRELAALVFAGRLALPGIRIRSPLSTASDPAQLEAIQAGYARYRAWYPRLYTVVGVAAAAPLSLALRAPFYAFYARLVAAHSPTISSLALDVRDADAHGGLDGELALRAFLDSVRLCAATTQLALRLRGRMRTDSALRAQAVVENMVDLRRLSFAGFSPEPYAVYVAYNAHAAHRRNRHILDLLPPTLVSLRIAGRVSTAMAVYNENSMQAMLDADLLPALTTVDISAYRMPLAKHTDTPGLMLKLAHPNSRIHRVLLPPDAEATHYSRLCLRRLFLQGHVLRDRHARHALTVVVADADARTRASRAKAFRKTLADFDIRNVDIEC
jgi:hypothetical protein